MKNQTMLSSLTVSRLLFFFIFLAIVLLLHLGLLMPCWYSLIKHVKQHVNDSSQSFHSQLQSDIDKTTKLLNLMSSASTTNLARVLASSVDGSKLSFPEIEKVAPILFHTLLTSPHLSQVSYIGREGVVFSYYIERGQTFALYSNSSFDMTNNSSSSTTPNAHWYTQLVDSNTGKLYGNVFVSSPPVAYTNSSSFREALNRTNGYSFLGTRWNNSEDLLFIKTASVNGKGIVSLGFSVKEITEFYTDIDLKGGRSYLATKDGKILAGDSVLSLELMGAHGDQNVSCNSNGTWTRASGHTSFQGSSYEFYCSQLDMLGVHSVYYVLATPRNELISFVHKHSRTSLILLISIIVITVISIFSFVAIISWAAIREMHLRAALIRQMEATEQAERKSRNKSLAFASASHDIRASLAGMTGLIEVCYKEVPKGSDMKENLRQLDGCAKDLLGILNSILDTSKTEAGKMQLEEEKFDLAQLLEDVVDLYHPMGAKKGTDVVFDPCDGSVCKFSHVKGDRGKLRQILCNLLSNAVKFTSDGHVSVRAWVRKPSLKSPVSASNRSGLMQHLSRIFYKNKREHDQDLEEMNVAKNDPYSIELIFEVDDTGKGIPKEKQKEIFENYVQVKETAAGQVGTGLGLGIVQSLVRLMHGEIAVMEKEIGEKGSCFRFNIFVTLCENNASESVPKEKEIELCPGDSISNPQSGVLTPGPQVEGSYVVLLIRNNERRRISQKFMESLGIKVLVPERWEQLPRTLKKIRRKWHNSGNKSYSSMQSEFLTKSSSSQSSCNIGVKDEPFSSATMDGTDYIPSLFRKTNYPRGTSLGFVLMVIDATAGPFSELCEVVNEFRNGLQNACCRVVWLANPLSQSIDFNSSVEGQMIDSDDIVKYKPFHGSRLHEVVRLLPEFGGSLLNRESRTASSQVGTIISKAPPPASSSSINDQNKYKVNKSEIQEVMISSDNDEAALRGKKILVADDSLLLRKLTVVSVSKFGAAVDTCENGKEALELVSNGLANQGKPGDPMSLPYDYILMDCEMPIMSGYEATREIRKMEELYGVHTPIIALTAHTPGSEEANKTIKAGMDVYLSKPLKSEEFLEAIRYIHSKNID